MIAFNIPCEMVRVIATDDFLPLVQVMAWRRLATANVDPDLCRHMA